MESIDFSVKIRPFSQKIILIQLLIAIGIPFGILIIVLILVNAWEALILIGVLFLVGSIFISLLYGKYSLHYTIDKKGILCEPNLNQKKLNNFMNNLTVFFGFFSRNISAGSTGFIAQSHQSQFYSWNSIKLIQQEKNSFIITNKLNLKMLVSYPIELESKIKHAIQAWGKDIKHD